ncbi:MAG: hypothetical protein ABSG05_02780 [Candidatus Pacearchaeota archaeon]|jgi:hypothetical protein
MPRRKRRVVRQREDNSPLQRRIHILWKNLVLFLILFIVSLGFFFLSTEHSIFFNLFEILFIVFGFLSLALLIILIILLIVKSGRK